jgi:hypothetical protein
MEMYLRLKLRFVKIFLFFKKNYLLIEYLKQIKEIDINDLVITSNNSSVDLSKEMMKVLNEQLLENKKDELDNTKKDYEKYDIRYLLFTKKKINIFFFLALLQKFSMSKNINVMDMSLCLVNALLCHLN